MGKFSNSLILDRQRLYFLYGGGKVQLYKQTHDNGIILYHAAIRENEKRVSVIMADDNEEKPLYDFSLSSGSIFIVDNMRLQYFPSWYAKGSDGHIRRLLHMVWNFDQITDTIPVAYGSAEWVEGVGAFTADLFDPAGLHREYVFQSCYLGSVRSFVYEDLFNIVSPDGIDKVDNDKLRDAFLNNAAFDLQGRLTMGKTRRGLHIHHGRKYVAR